MKVTPVSKIDTYNRLRDELKRGLEQESSLEDSVFFKHSAEGQMSQMTDPGPAAEYISEKQIQSVDDEGKVTIKPRSGEAE